MRYPITEEREVRGVKLSPEETEAYINRTLAECDALRMENVRLEKEADWLAQSAANNGWHNIRVSSDFLRERACEAVGHQMPAERKIRDEHIALLEGRIKELEAQVQGLNREADWLANELTTESTTTCPVNAGYTFPELPCPPPDECCSGNPAPCWRMVAKKAVEGREEEKDER